MIIIKNPIKLYGKKVVTDLATRTGNSTVDDFSYGLGLNYKVRELWAGEETDANLEALFEEQQDFDADVKQPQQAEEDYSESEEDELSTVARYQPSKDKTDFNGYYRRLEDIASPYLESYVGNLIYTICRLNGGVKAYNSKHMVQPTLMSQGDDSDDFTELADLQLLQNDKDWSTDAKYTALQNLPYVLKRLHSLSCYCGIHMLSFIVAYLKAKEKNTNMRIAGSIKTLKKNAVIEEGVYLCSERGNIIKQVLVQNKNVKAAQMFDWIIGVNKSYAAYYQDYLDFVHYCKVLNIDLFNDDMTKYGSDFISKLVVTTVTPNKQYDKQVFEAILNKGTQLKPEEPEVDLLDSTMNTFQQICQTNEKVQEYLLKHDSIISERNMNTAKSLYNTYRLLYEGEATEMDKYYWENGYLFYDGELAILKASMLGTREFKNDQCIISELGYCIHVSEYMSLFVLTVNNALENVRNRLFVKDPEYKYVDWMRLGA